MAGFNSNIEIEPYTFSEASKPKPRLFEFSYGQDAKPNQPSSLTSNDFNEALRTTNSNATKARLALPLSNVAKAGVGSFNRVSSQVEDLASQYKSLSNADLERVKGLDEQGLQANINRIKQYEPLANNEANRAYGNELATKLPYSTFEKSADLFSGAKTLSSSLPGILDSLRYQKNVTMSL